ncbi:histidine phosphatase family protein [Desemzia sp. RIT804]|uniref:histidine phosphatase family protein n=1 Tax=Desemzia sp. RIT 804 TaxID=2810209 RepID=UPI00194EB453|nr:histidine phosphatase family protein [Desemzia sp. RIT 804]MBM6615916.1 histidine phosphatase family protein [Desemzia sp. RIT 804]
MPKLYFVRHGKTEYNLANRVQGGDVDSPLLLESKEDAIKTGLALQKKQIPHIIASPQHRAVETAELITNQFQHPFTVHFTEKFKELKYGEWEGAFIPALQEASPEMFYHLREKPELYDPRTIKGETYTDLVKRGKEVVQSACAAFPDHDLLFVGHSITITCTMLSLIGKEIKDFRSAPPIDNTSISIIKLTDSTYSLESWNDTSHLS